MLYEMATRGVAMAVLLGIVWATMVSVCVWRDRAHSAAIPQGA